MQMRKFSLYNIQNNQNQAIRDAYNMLTANVHVNSIKHKLRTITLTSCNPGEGKTSMANSLALSMAYVGWKVLLVDANMRKPTAAKRQNEGSQFGLSDFLVEDVELTDVICETNVKNLMYISCGSDHQNPIGLLCSDRFKDLINKVNNEYDFVLFDTPALGSVVDGAIVASNVDATLLVVRMGFTSINNIARVKDQLNNMNANILGVVLNRVKKHDYKRYFSSYNYYIRTKNNKTKSFFKDKIKRSLLHTRKTIKYFTVL